MSDDHRKVAEELLAYVNETLETEKRRAVEDYVASSEEGQRALETLVWMRKHAREHGSALFEGPVDAQKMVLLAEAPHELSADERELLERQLRLDPWAEEELRILREVNRDLQHSKEPTPSLAQRLVSMVGLGTPAPAWAYAALLLLLLPAALGVRGLLQRPGDVVSVLPQPHVLVATDTRAPAELTKLALPSDGPLALRVSVPRMDDPNIRYDGMILDASSSEIWFQRDLPSLDQFGTTLLLIERAALYPGQHVLLILEMDRSEDARLQEFRFEFELDAP